MRPSILIPLPLLLAGCLTIPTQQVPQVPTRSFESPLAAEAVAGCLLESLPGAYQWNRVAPWHYVISRASNELAPGARWDVLATDGGSRVSHPDIPELAGEIVQARECGGVPAGS